MVNLVKTTQKILDGNDSIVIRKYIDGIEGGRALDMTDFVAVTGSSILHAGHVIITKDGVYKPMPVEKSTTTVPQHYEYTPKENVSNPYSEGLYVEDATDPSGYSAVGSGVTTPAAGTTYYERTQVAEATVDDKDADGNQIYVYDDLPSNWNYAGILVASIDAAVDGAGIMTRGKVNKSDSVMPYSITSILSDLKAALPLIEFMEDAE
jgi:hypothetical protein